MAEYVNRTYLQFSQATNLNSLLDQLAPYLTIDEEEFYTNYFDIDTCNAQGLDNWGRILEVNRQYLVDDLENCLGFDNGTTPTNDIDYPQNFDQGNFWGGQTNTVTMDDDLYRIVLKFRYKVLTTNASLGAANNIMNTYFQETDPTKKCIVSQSGLMEITFTFNFFLTELGFVLANRKFLPIPLGVDFLIVQGAVF